MLSKIWKNLLLAICIIAILFNITSKLVNRISLEKTISSAPEGIDVRELLNIVEEEPVVEGSSVSTYNTVENETEVESSQNSNNSEEQMQEDIPPAEDNSNSGGIFDITDISDFTTLLY